MTKLPTRFPIEYSGDGGVSLLRKFTVWDMTERFGEGDVVFRVVDACAFIAHFQMRAVTTSTRVGFGAMSLAALDFRSAILWALKTNLRLLHLTLPPKSVGGAAIGIPSGDGTKDV